MDGMSIVDVDVEIEGHVDVDCFSILASREVRQPKKGIPYSIPSKSQEPSYGWALFLILKEFSSARLLFTPRGLAQASPKQVLVLTIYSSQEFTSGQSFRSLWLLGGYWDPSTLSLSLSCLTPWHSRLQPSWDSLSDGIFTRPLGIPPSSFGRTTFSRFLFAFSFALLSSPLIHG